VTLRRRHAGALRADFWRFYSLDFDRIGIDYGVLWAADLAVHLPPDSATKLAIGGGWSRGEQLLAAVVDFLALHWWAQTKDGAKNRNRPKQIPRPGVEDGSKARMKGAVLLPVDEVKRRLALPREPIVQDG